ncbi:MAG: hypothetical protein F4X95_01040 [Oligoflexia bacterium]|nr:hypothetical protein [Oligoflexia bacterium]
MLRKTTVYIEEDELDTLKTLSLIQNKSVAELIRVGVQKVCKSISREEMKALDVLTKIRQNTKKKGYSSKDIMNMALKAQREVRSERKKKKIHRY